MFATVISGVLVFVLSQYLLEFIFKPLKRYKEAVYAIDGNLKFYANRIGTSYILANKDTYENTVDVIRKLSCELEASYKQIIGHWLLEHIKLIPSRGSLEVAASILIRVSNSVGINEPGVVKNFEDIKEIRRLLNIDLLSN